MEKVKEVIHKATHPKEDTTATGTHTTGTHTGAHGGTHAHDSTLGGQHTGTTGTGSGLTGSHQTTAGPHSSNLANKTDPRVDSDRDGQGALQSSIPGSTGHNTHQTGGLSGSHNTHGTGGGYGTSTASTTAGPHSSNLANKLDPRVDSDRDGQGKLQSSVPGSTGHNTGSGLTGSNQQHTGVGGGYSNTGSTNTGQHSSNIANAADPRVDSDRSNAGYGQQGGLTGSHTQGTTGGYGNSGYQQDNSRSTNAGPHGSNIANVVDPRVDSDRSNTGYGQQGGLTGSHAQGSTGYQQDNPRSTNAGPYSSNIANVADPRVDSDRSNAGYGQQGGLTGSHEQGGLSGSHQHGHQHIPHDIARDGPAPNTAGPHKGDMLNKLDPRVDSDHSKTTHGNTQQY